MRWKLLGLGAFTASLFACAFACASDPFSISAQTTSGTPQTVTASGSSVIDLFRNLVKNESEFQSFGSRDVSAALTYGGVNNAVLVTKNAANTSATVDIPSIHFAKTFTGANESDLEKQIEDYIKKNGADIYGRFLRSLNGQSDLGVTDGNPLATTALLANQSFQMFGLEPAPFPLDTPPNPLDATATPRWRLDFSGGFSHTAAGDGYFAGGALTAGLRFGDRVGLTFSTPFIYRNVEGASMYNIGEEISVPLLLIPPTGNNSLSWLLTPTFIAGAAGSVDAAAGGTFLGGGITSSLSYQIGGFFFTLANQIDYFHGYPIGFGDWKFDTDLEQEVLKNGIRIGKSFGPHFFVDGSITRTDFLQRAAVDHYWSPGAGVGVRFGPNAGLRVGYSGDFGKGYNVNGGNVLVYFNY